MNSLGINRTPFRQLQNQTRGSVPIVGRPNLVQLVGSMPRSTRIRFQLFAICWALFGNKIGNVSVEQFETNKRCGPGNGGDPSRNISLIYLL